MLVKSIEFVQVKKTQMGCKLRMNGCYFKSLSFAIWVVVIANSQSLVQSQSPDESKKAGEKFRNVQVLSEMPADEMGKVMNMISASLGVNCNFCHEGTQFAKENVGKKDVARAMLTMTLGLNRDFFHGRAEVNCYTCHRGQTRPSTKLSLERAKPETPWIQPKNVPTPREVLAKHVAAVGGTENATALKTLHVIAKRIEPNGASETEELWQTASGLSRMVTQYGSVAVVEGFDGTNAWKRANDNAIALKSDEAEQIRIEATVAFASDSFVQRYANATFLTVEMIENRDVYVLKANSESKLMERLYFDVQSGVLSRRVASIPTVLGAFEFQVTYRDYKKFAGVEHPTHIQFDVPNITWTRQVTAIESNVPLNDAFFRKSQ